MDRRTALKTLALASAAAGTAFAVPRRLLAAPRIRHLRVRGRVTVDGAPRGGVVVSDGLGTVTTAADGTYTLPTTTASGFVFVTLPGDVQVPVAAAGTAAFHHALGAGAASEVRADFPLRRLVGDPDRQSLLLVADPQVQHAADIARMHAEAVPDLRETVKLLSDRPPVIVGCGDIMYDRLEHLGEWEAALRHAAAPGFQVLGNHDVEIAARTDHDSARTFQRRFGPTWYSFDRGETHVVVLDDVFWYGGYLGYLDRLQLDWLASDLRHVEAGRRVLVCLHIPTWSTRHLRHGAAEPPQNLVVVNRELLYELLAPYRATILCGHMHELEIIRDHPVEVHVCGALCGAWWTGPVCGDGTPSGYMVYDLSGGDLRWRYKSTGHAADHQLRVYPRGADPTAPGLVLANVWAADDRWRILWSADGQRQGAMVSRRGQDPLARQLYEGPERPDDRAWAEPYVTDHLYACEPGAGVREVTVEATDPWGRTYRESLAI